MIEFFYSVINTVFFIGKIKGGGTIVSFLLLFLWFFFIKGSFTILFDFFSLILFLSYISISNSKKFFGDDKRIVIDELVGATISIMFLPKNFLVIFISILIFRYLDISKIFFLDRFEKIEGATGILLDDIMAGILANLITHFIIFIL
uniref:Phosphatidylglycerophosphatase A n=1 Tax=candidate division WOR-3 bacterium TaxID=2052148 RepID=A0A7C3N7S8_UNCW3